jgi:hypothetical protein
MTIFSDGLPEIYASPWAIYLPGGGATMANKAMKNQYA